jgi:choline-sulfatase/uncharacterized sulfatase
MNKRNVVWIVADQHNARFLGFRKLENIFTPNLDRLASEGVWFENAICQNPICTPSRVSFLSGQYCHNHGYYGLSGENPGGLPSIIGHFRSEGYRTAAIGKIHCPEYWVEDDCDVFHETCDDCSIEGRSPDYTAYLKSEGVLEREDHICLTEFGDRGKQSVDARPSAVSYRQSQEGWAANRAVEFIQAAREEEKPFFLFLSLPKPHQCYAPAQEFWDLYPEESLELPPNSDWDLAGKSPALRRRAAQWRKEPWRLFEPKTFEAGRLRKLRGYLGCISHVDHAVGEVTDALDRMGLSSDTIVLYMSDHGDYACQHGIMEKAPGICSDAVTRIPMIWRCPGLIKDGHCAKELVESVDVATTLPALAGLEPLLTGDGKDISGLLQGQAGEVRSLAVTEFAWSASIRQGKYRLVYYPREFFAQDYPDGFGELYNLQEDPWEMNNLYFQPEFREVVDRMFREYEDWKATSTRPKTLWPPMNQTGKQVRRRYTICSLKDGKISPDFIRNQASEYYL